MKRCHRATDAALTNWYVTANELPTEWDTGLPEDHFLLRESLKVQESARLPDVSARYAMLLSNGIVVARAAFQVLRVRADYIKEASLQAWQYNAWKAFTKTARPKLLIGGQLFRHDVSSVHWSDSLKPYDVFVWYRAAIKEVGRKTHCVAVLLKELPEALVPHFLHLAPEYLLLRNDISMQLPIPNEWQGMKDYEQSLKHKYAQRFRKVQQSWGKLRVTELSEDEVAACAQNIYRLYQQVTENQSVRMGILNAAFLPALKKAYGDRLKVWAIWEGETMVAFASGWVSEERFDMFYIGFDYTRNAELNLYFNILFFAVEQAIEMRKSLLILGRTALEAKARVGCEPQYLNTFLFVRNPLLRNIVARLQSTLGERSGEWEQRHPFKNK
jgi:hypothetical protein